MHGMQQRRTFYKGSWAGGFGLIEILVALLLLCMVAGVLLSECHKQQARQKAIKKDLPAGMSDLAVQIAESLDETGKKTVAVVQFSNLDGRTTQFGQFVSEELTTQLFKTKVFKVIERHLIARLVEEHQLGFSGLLDKTSVKEFGKVLGADAICSGTIADLGGGVRINARLIDVQDGSVFAVAAVQINKDDRVRTLMKQMHPAKGV